MRDRLMRWFRPNLWLRKHAVDEYDIMASCARPRGWLPFPISLRRLRRLAADYRSDDAA